MRHALAFSTALLMASAAIAAADLTASESKRLDEAATVIQQFKAAPDSKGIPEDLWNKAECITVIPNMKKAAFIVGGEYGKGVMSCRAAGSWSAPMFIELEKGSAGFQIGGEQVDLVLLMMNRGGVDKLLQDKVTLGGDAAVAAGPVGRMASAATDAQLHAGILAYSRAEGAFAGINISGGVLHPDKSANEHAYGQSYVARDILASNHALAPAAAQAFLRTLSNDTRATSGRK
jgi:lipid-binding SYLF domain-containing protein